jgi:hypothetical protein
VTVTGLEISNKDVEGLVTFIGLFEDGTKRQFVKPTYAAWYVKLESIPEGYPSDEVYYTESQIAIMPDEQLESIRSSGLTDGAMKNPLGAEAEELKKAMANLVGTSKAAWTNIMDMLKEGLKEEADLLDAAAERLYANSKNVTFSEQPEDLGEKKPFYRQATMEDMVRNFVRNNRDFFMSKNVHSLNEVYSKYNDHCGNVIGWKWKLSRRDFMQHMKTYFEAWVDMERRDSEGTYVVDTELTGFSEDGKTADRHVNLPSGFGDHSWTTMSPIEEANRNLNKENQ